MSKKVDKKVVKKARKKTSWKKVNPMVAAVKFAKVGQSVEGKLTRVQQEVGKQKSTLYHFIGSDGAFAVWGSANLASQLEGLELGMDVKIEYTGIAKTSNGFKCKTFDVYTK